MDANVWIATECVVNNFKNGWWAALNFSYLGFHVLRELECIYGSFCEVHANSVAVPMPFTTAVLWFNARTMSTKSGMNRTAITNKNIAANALVMRESLDAATRAADGVHAASSAAAPMSTMNRVQR